MLIPYPKHVDNHSRKIKIAHTGKNFCYTQKNSGYCLENEGAGIIFDTLKNYSATAEPGYDYKIVLKTDKTSEVFDTIDSDEAYYVDIGENEAVLCGKTEQGTFYAAQTFAQLIHKVGDEVYVDAQYIKDYPDFKYRGHFIECRYGTEFMTLSDWFAFIDYMAGMKLNQLTVGVYGCWSVQYDDRPMEYLYIPISTHPELKTPKNIKYYSVKENRLINIDNLMPSMYKQDFLGKIIAYGKKRNVTVKPLFNSLGHNTLIPRLIPEISAKDQNGKSVDHGFCTNNPLTYEVMCGIYDEIIEKYLKPNGITDIEIGMDEVADIYKCKCEECRKTDFPELCIRYIIRLCKHLIKRGMKRIYIYHDMLFSEFDMINDDLKNRFIDEGIYENVVIDWWTYEDPSSLFWGREKDVCGLFHSVIKPATGYYNWAIPTENNENIRACIKVAQKHGFEGVESYSSFEYCYDKNYKTLADVSWNTDGVDNSEEFDTRYARSVFGEKASGALDALRAMSDIMKDESRKTYMNRACKHLEYYFYCYRNNYFTSESARHKFPDEAYQKIEDNAEEYLHYLNYLKQKSSAAISFFENCGKYDRLSRIWLLTAKHYYTLSDEYLSLYAMQREYSAGNMSAFDVIIEADRLLKQREALMLLAEDVRESATSYTYLRNMSVFRQILADLKSYFETALSKGETPVLDMKNFSSVSGKTHEFLL